MLVYFHYACGGHAPLDTDWSSPKSPYGIMSKEQIEYLQMAKREVDRQGEWPMKRPSVSVSGLLLI